MKKQLLTIVLLCIFFPLIGQPFGNAINLDGIDDYCIVSHHESLNPSDGDWSVAFWIKAANKDQVAPVVMKRLPEDPYTQYSFGFGMDDPHNPEPGKRIRLNYIDVPGVSERSGHTTGEYIDGNWHHIVISTNKTEDGMVVFVDGIRVEFYPLYYFGSWPVVTNINDLYIGAGSSGSRIEGHLDELSIWNKALDLEDVQMIMNDTIPPLYYSDPLSGLVAYYRFDAYEDLGINADGPDDFRDLSVWQNHADAEGNPELIPSGIPVGIYDPIKNSGLLIFPNPATNQLNIRVPRFNRQPAKISLYSSTSVKIKELILPIGNEEINFNISHLPAGIYFVRICTDNELMVKKIIKL